MMIAWGLRALRVPFRMRWAIIPLFLGIYVFMTGARPSAVRAWLMLSVWALSKASFRPAVPMNAVAVAAWVLSVCRPLSLLQMGVQFSFIVVVALLAMWPHLASMLTWVAEKERWIPRRARKRGLTGILPVGRVVQMALASVVAWFAGVGLVAWYNGLFVPGAVLINTVVAALAFLGALLVWPKLLLGCLPFASIDAFVGHALEGIVQGVRILADLGAREPLSFTVGRPAPGLVVLYYMGVALLLTRSGWAKRLRLLSGAVACVALGLIVIGPGGGRPQLVIFAGGDGATPGIVLDDSPQVPPVVINTGGRNGARGMLAWLALNGYGHVEQLIVGGRTWGECGGATDLLDGVSVRVLVLPENTGTGRWSALAARQFNNGGRVRSFPLAESSEGAPATAEGHELSTVRIAKGSRVGLRVTRCLTDGPSIVSCTRLQTGETVVAWEADGRAIRWQSGTLWRPTLYTLRLPD